MSTYRGVRPPPRPPNPPPSRTQIELEKLEHELKATRTMIRDHDEEVAAWCLANGVALPPKEETP